MKKNTHISLVIIMLSITLFCSYHIYYYFQKQDSKELIREYYQNNNVEPQLVTQINMEEKEEYLGILKISKLNLEEGFYSPNSKNNYINKSVTILKESVLPIGNGSIIYLVAHSGSGYLAFFKDLNKLVLDDSIEINLDNHHYQYAVSKIYEVNNSGEILVNHNIHEDYLVLSTCSNHMGKQLVVVSKLIRID